VKAGSLGKNLLIDHDHALIISYEKFHTRTLSEIRHQWTHKYFPPVFQAPECSRSKLRLLAVAAATVRQYIAAKKKKKMDHIVLGKRYAQRDRQICNHRTGGHKCHKIKGTLSHVSCQVVNKLGNMDIEAYSFLFSFL